MRKRPSRNASKEKNPWFRSDISPKSSSNPDDAPAIDELSRVDEEPYPLNIHFIKTLIGYPPVARQAGIEGMAVYRILVDKTGRPIRSSLLKSAHPLLDREIERYIINLRFIPVIEDGKEILFWVNIPFNFKLLD